MSTCRTTFNRAARRRMLPPFYENPFARFGIDKLRDDADKTDGKRLFTPLQEKAFFGDCSEWQRPIS